MNKKYLAIAILAVGLLGGAGIKAVNSRGVKDVRLATVARENLEESVRLEGVVAPKNMYNLYTEVPLVVDEVVVNLGQEVKAGDILVKFSQGSVESVENDIRGLELDLRNAKLELDDLESGSMKLDLDSRKLETERMENQMKSLRRKELVVKNELANLTEEAEVKMRLFSAEGISSIEANDVITRKARKEMEYEDIKTEVVILQERLSLSVMGYERLKRELAIQKNMIESRIEKYQLSLNQMHSRFITELKAPVDGVVSALEVENGTPVTPSKRVMTIVTHDDFVVKTDVPASIVETLKKGMDADIVSRDNYEDRVYSGKVDKIARVIKTVDRGNYEDKVVEVELSLDSAEGLKPGSPVDIDILGNRMEMITVVDAFSVLEENGRNYVYTIEEGRARKQEVSIGVKTFSKYQVLDLQEGTEIVVNPFAIRNGDKTKIIR